MDNSTRQDGTPLLVTSPTEPGSLLEPLSLDRPPINERTLQQLLALNPTVLPTTEIDPLYTGLHLLGCEVPTPVGPIDLIFITSDGDLVLVETKLWKNPDARRKVVGQIIDYAKELSKWTFEALNSAVQKAQWPTPEKPAGVIDVLTEAGATFDEPRLIDRISKNLRLGRFLLLIVGDGIRDSVVDMAQYLAGTPSLQFTLALVELKLFRLHPGQDWPLLIHPRLTTRTNEVERAVVVVRAPEHLQIDVELPQTTQAVPSRTTVQRRLNEQVFYDELAASTSPTISNAVATLMEDLQNRGCVFEWRAASVSVRLPDPGASDNDFTVVIFTKDGRFYLGWLRYITEKGGYDEDLWRRYLQRVQDLTGAQLSQDTVITTLALPIAQLLSVKKEFLDAVDQLIDEMQAAAVEQKL